MSLDKEYSRPLYERSTRHKVRRKERLNPKTSLIEIEAPLIAKKVKPGQFIVIRLHEKGERTPLTVFKSDSKKGTITIVFLKEGKTTKELDKYEEGDELADVIGPNGNPIDVEKVGTVVCVGGGVGTPGIYPIAKALREVGNTVIGIIGFANKETVILEDDIKEVTDEFYVTTDDGSYGQEGFTSDVLKKLIEGGRDIDLVYAIGPTIMMKVISDLTRPYGIKTMVSLNPIMVDATGMCGSCRVKIEGDMRLTCVDGPVFDGHKVDFEELMNRQRLFREKEAVALDRLEE